MTPSQPLTGASLDGTGGQIALIALGYFGLGKLGLFLAIPPGYASPVFPAAGFAVAIMLWSPLRAWPGILLGALLLNLGVGSLDVAGRTATVLTALGIAAGSTLQAHVAATLVARLTGDNWRQMESARDIARILIVAGPLACLISASIGVATLSLGSITPANDALFTWWTWWAGGVLGVLVVLPLSLAVLLRKYPPWRTRQLALGLPMLTVLGVIVAAYMAEAQWERGTRELELRRHAEQLARLLEERFIAHEEALAALKRLIEVSPDMSYAQFEHFTRITLRENPDIFALSFNPYVRHAERAVVERRLAKATDKLDFEIKERDANKRLVRAVDRPEYVVVGYIAPQEGNRPAIGYDINSEPVRQDAIRRARASQRLGVTATIQLVQENQKRVGALLLYPAYRTAAGSGAPTDADLLGFAVGVVKLDQLVEIATAAVRVPGLAFRIDDVAGGQSSQVYLSDGAPVQQQALPLAIALTMADRQWRLTVYPTASYQMDNRSWVAWATSVVGLLLAALLQMLLLVTTGQAATAERKVRLQSAELEDRGALIAMLFELSPDGFIAVAADGTVKLANPAFLRMTGLLVEDIVGKPMADLEGRLRSLAENPEQWRGLGECFPVAGKVGSGETASGGQRHLLALQVPRGAVLELVGVTSEAGSVSRLLYVRDVTHEVEVDRMKSEFLSHAAHELRTPMASIFGFTELLMNQEFDEATRKDLLATIHRQTAWLVDIINELLDLARIEARRGRAFKLEAVAVGPLVEDVLAAMSIDLKQWPLVIDLPEDLPAVRADAAKLMQALTNVLGNAVKYSPAGGAIAVCADTRTDARGQRQVGITVADHGIGMTAEQLGRVCERFYRADTSGNIPGTGLGMSIVKEIVDLLGGHLDLASTPGQGTTVTLWLPAAAAAPRNHTIPKE